MSKAILLLVGLMLAAVFSISCDDKGGQPASEPLAETVAAGASAATSTPRPIPTPGAASTPTGVGSTGIPSGSRQALVTRVVDGDTIDVRVSGFEHRVRLILVDTPEVFGSEECFGREASAYVSGLIGPGSIVYLEKDVSEQDRYDRLLRYVYRESGQMVNELLVREGYAVLAPFPPDLKYYDRIRSAEGAARERSKGLWGACAAAAAPERSAPQGVAPAATVTPAPTAVAVQTPIVVPAPSIVAFCNAVAGATADACAAAGATPLLASASWSVWATNVGNFESAVYALDSRGPYTRDALKTAFAALQAGPHSVQIGDSRDGSIVWSVLWPFDIAAPTQTLAQQECATYTQAYQEARAQGAAQVFLNFLLGRIALWC